MILPAAKVSEQVNRKCLPRNTLLQLSTHHTDPIPSKSNSPPFEPQMSNKLNTISRTSELPKCAHLEKPRLVTVTTLTVLLIWTLTCYRGYLQWVHFGNKNSGSTEMLISNLVGFGPDYYSQMNFLDFPLETPCVNNFLLPIFTFCYQFCNHINRWS